MNQQMLKQLGVGSADAPVAIEERAVEAEAERLGLKVADAEVRERILPLPALQENGQFVG